MEKRTQKQLIIGLIFVLIIGGIGYGFIDYFFLTEATCFDKVQNGIEEGVDCGLLACGVACESAIIPLSVVSQKLIEVRPGDYDFVAQINNPNPFFGASRVRYTLDFGGVEPDRSGTFYILPGQTRFVIVPGVRSDGALSGISIDITEVIWEKVEIFEDISFPVQRKSYTVIDKNGVFSELEAVILNNSDFDFDKVEVGVILFSVGGDIIAVNITDIRTFLSKTERYFKVSWPTELPEGVRQDVEVLTNVFENANFIRRYGTQERFQKYY
ncbi:MAG: hypothetical protein HY505_02840 [Candidatus Yanofskybacteria bacterium]|nr:hypothetical protein [Candidatus Yanofskybacteria bacterium]